MTPCNWKFIPYKAEEWHGVSGSFMSMRDRWYCDEHFTTHYGSEQDPPRADLCAIERAEYERKARVTARRRRWYLFKTLPHRLWLTLKGVENMGYCSRCDDYD